MKYKDDFFLNILKILNIENKGKIEIYNN